MNQHLWEIEHPYSCESASYWHRDSKHHHDYSSFDGYLSLMGDSDADLNLLFRWDWREDEGLLKLYYIVQRKGIFSSHFVQIKREDEEAVKKYLIERYKKMQELWQPFTNSGVLQ